MQGGRSVALSWEVVLATLHLERDYAHRAHRQRRAQVDMQAAVIERAHIVAVRLLAHARHELAVRHIGAAQPDR
eukprot:4184814-Prymnesium_polylepis.3